MTNHFLQEIPRRAGRTKDGLMTAGTTLDIPALDRALDDLRLRIVGGRRPWLALRLQSCFERP
jgi:hypothetical protein